MNRAKTNPNIPANPNSTEGYTAADQLPGGCETCDGTGHARGYLLGGPAGFFEECDTCHGTGDPQ